MQVKLRVVLLLVFTLMFASLLADTDKQEPDIDLLEFLGKYQDEQGNWIDPTEMEEINLTEEYADEQATEQ